MRRLALVVLIALAALALACGGKAPEKKLNIYIWTNYLPDDVLADFERRTGIHATVDTYDSNEVLLQKLQSGVADYDVVVPSDYMVPILVSQKLLLSLDKARLQGLDNLDPRFLDRELDPGNTHSIPYLWGTTGLGYDRTKVAAPLDSWSALFDARYKGRILMLDDPREAFGVVLKLMGRSLNETDPAVLRQAADRLKAQKALVKTYNSSDFANLLAAGDVDISHGWNGELAELAAKDPKRFAYVVPKEGSTLWIDSLAIPARATHVEEAYAFFSFLLEPEVAARVVNGVHYAGANKAAWDRIKPEIRNDPSIYPPEEVLDRCELLKDLGPATQLIDELWTEIKAQ
ncbi:MAG: spermidine/putrescine ABC transporter substrate-binding protein [Acidobacteriota bacterium]